MPAVVPRVPQIDLAAVLAGPNPHIDLRTESFDASSRNFLKAVANYKTRTIAALVDKRAQHTAETKRAGERIASVDAETKECKIQELQLAAELQKEQEDRKEAELNVAGRKRQLAALQEKCANVDAQIEHYRSIADNFQRIKKNEKDALLASAAGVTSQTRAIEDRIACTVEAVANDQLLIRFTRIDPENTDREFSLVLDLSGDSYRVVTITPALPALSDLVWQLRKTGDIIAFIRDVRRAFGELVAPNAL
ncbi:Glycoside hydrolase [Mycena kentingensis (nom. inval.)]|nr:Glycoside hydrolase [Mycena kentingensis (nom. inval.)]